MVGVMAESCDGRMFKQGQEEQRRSDELLHLPEVSCVDK